jgi:hypothetical protein
VSAPDDYFVLEFYLVIEFTIEFTCDEPAPVAAICFCAVQCITEFDEQSAEHSAAVLAAHCT